MINAFHRAFSSPIAIILVSYLSAGPDCQAQTPLVKIEPLQTEPTGEQHRVPAIAAGARKAAGAHVKAAKAIFTRFIVSPDASKAAVLYRKPAGALYELVVVRSPGGSIEKPMPPELRVAEVAWRPDSRMLAVVARVAHPTDTSGGSLYIYDLAGRSFRRVFKPAEGSIYSMQWHPGGNTLAFLVSDPFETGDRLHGNLFLIEVAGSEVKKLTKAPHWTSPVWSPAGRQLAVADERVLGLTDGALCLQIFDSHGTSLKEIDLRPALAGTVVWDAQVLAIRWLTEQALAIRVGAFDGHKAQDERWFKVSW